MKKEYLIPLAIIISVIILSVSVYLGLTVKHRHYKAVCQTIIKETEDTKFYKMIIVTSCKTIDKCRIFMETPRIVNAWRLLYFQK